MQRARMAFDDIGVFSLLASALTMQPMGHATFGERDRTEDAPAAKGEKPERSLLDRLDHWFWKREQDEREAYLAAATDIYDLEVRIRSLERGAPWRYY